MQAKNILYSKRFWGLILIVLGFAGVVWGEAETRDWCKWVFGIGLAIAGIGSWSASQPLRLPATTRKTPVVSKRLDLVLLAAAMLLAGCQARDARSLYGKVTAISGTLHQAVVTADEAQKAAGVPIATRLERYEAAEKILGEYRAVEADMKRWAMAMDAAERIGDRNSQAAINAKARAQQELAASIAARLLKLLVEQQERGQ